MPTDPSALAGTQENQGDEARHGDAVPDPAAVSDPAADPGPAADSNPAAERPALELAFALAMRRTGSLMQLIGQLAAERIGINATDLNCLNILSLAGKMTAGQLAAATGLTTASITGVVDRLEQAGYARRERDTRDRRRVVIHLIGATTARDVVPVFLPMVLAWRETAAHYSESELKLILEFQSRMEQVLRDHLARMRAGAP